MEFKLLTKVFVYNSKIRILANIEAFFYVVVPDHSSSQNPDHEKASTVAPPWVKPPLNWCNFYSIPQLSFFWLHTPIVCINEIIEFF